MIFVWTFDDIVTAIMLGFLAIIILGCVFICLIGSFIEWLKRWMPCRSEKTREEESEVSDADSN